MLLITPESLEALFILQGTKLTRIFEGLQAVVIDELHAFIGSERGCQLRSLLHRLELSLRRIVPRVGLSATLGDMGMAAEFLRPGGGAEVLQIEGEGTGREVRLQLRAYERLEGSLTDLDDIADHLFDKLRGKDNLIFANSRSMVEQMAARLRERCEQARVPQEFFPHHGSLSRELRKEAEQRLKDGDRPGNVLCTSTLEMGVDVGNVDSVAQIGAPPSVASLLQRLGRSGRRLGRAATLRLYVSEDECTAETPLADRLREELVQAAAMVELMGQHWCEPPAAESTDLSTLVQQLLSLIAQYGGAQPHEAFQALCKSGPFSRVQSPEFADLLRVLAAEKVLRQLHDGTLLLEEVGEKLVEHYSFYAAFNAVAEWRLVHGGKTLGTLPISQPMQGGAFLIFAGRSWMVHSADETKRVLEVEPATTGRAPRFGGTGALVHDRVRKQMLSVYRSDDLLPYLDETGARLLRSAREQFRAGGLAHRAVIADGKHTLLFPWAGDRVHATITLQLRARGRRVGDEGLALRISRTDPDELYDELEEMVAEGPIDPAEAARGVANLQEQKYDRFLSPELLAPDWAARHLDAEGAHEALRRLARGEPPHEDAATMRRSD